MTKKEFEILYEENYQKLLRYERNHVHEDMVEDILQEVFCLAWEKREIVRNSCNPAGWLMNVAKNKNHDYWRKYCVKTVSLDDIQDETGTEDQSMSRKEFLLFLEQYLNPRECQILLCITLKEKSMKELAQIQGVTLYCLRRDLEKAKLRLQYALKERMVVKR